MADQYAELGGRTVSNEQNRSIARRYLDEVWNRADEAVIDQIIAADYAVHDPGTPGRAGTPAGEKQVLAMYRAVFPDLRFVIEGIVAEGDQVAVRWRASGTHRGELMGIDPTGRSVSIDAVSWLRIANGQIAEHWLSWDSLGMLRQLGALPATPQPVG
jgi:steroid delta-isomerase-like uncharacterized protein